MQIKLNGARILITGGTGSWGSALARRILEQYKPAELIILSRGEVKQVEMRRTFNNPLLTFVIGDVRDKQRLMTVFQDVDYVFHCAALKHIDVCEANPWEAVLTNIYGTQNVIEAAIERHVKAVIDISTDKAVDPFNLYGATKNCGEKLVIEANFRRTDCRFFCIRGGNVLGTNGSVIPFFKEQIAKQNKITVTDPKMTRFLMTIEDAMDLIFEAMYKAHGGEIFVVKMPAFELKELAEVMIKELGNKDTSITTLGLRPGEKIDEVLVSKHEARRTVDSGNYFIILPQLRIPDLEKAYEKYPRVTFEEFNSKIAQRMSKNDIFAMLEQNGYLSVTPE